MNYKSVQVEINTYKIENEDMDVKWYDLDFTGISVIPNNVLNLYDTSDPVKLGINKFKNVESVTRICAGAFTGNFFNDASAGGYINSIIEEFSFPNCEVIEGACIDTNGGAAAAYFREEVPLLIPPLSSLSMFMDLSLPKCKYIGPSAFYGSPIKEIALPEIETICEDAFADIKYQSMGEGDTNIPLNVTLGSKLKYVHPFAFGRTLSATNNTCMLDGVLTMPLLSKMAFDDKFTTQRDNIVFSGRNYYYYSFGENMSSQSFYASGYQDSNVQYFYPKKMEFDCDIKWLNISNPSTPSYNIFTKYNGELSLPDCLEVLQGTAVFGHLDSVSGEGHIVGNMLSNGMVTVGSPNNSNKLLALAFGDAFASFVSGKTSLSAGDFPEGVNILGDNAFSYVSGYLSDIKAIAFPEGLTYIGSDALAGMELTSSCIVPNTLKYFGTDLISRAGEAIRFTGDMETDPLVYGYLDNAQGAGVIGMAIAQSGISSGDYLSSMDSNTRVIWTSAVNDVGLEFSVTLPPNVVTIAEGGFAYQNSLKNITFNDKLEIIADAAFMETGLTSVSFPSSLKYIGKNAFASTSISSLVLPSTVEYIDSTAFNLSAITYLECTIPQLYQLTGNGEKSLDNVTKVKLVDSDVKETYIAPFRNLQEITFPTNIEVIFGLTTQYSGSTLTIPSTVKNFYGAASAINLTNITFEGDMKSFGIGANFWGCSMLSSISIPNSVEEIGGNAFIECTALENVTFPSALKRIGENAFVHTNLSEVRLPKHTTIIGSSAFASCSNIKRIWIPEELNCAFGIGENAFGASALSLEAVYVDAQGLLLESMVDILGEPATYYINDTISYIPSTCALSSYTNVTTDVSGYKKYVL